LRLPAALSLPGDFSYAVISYAAIAILPLAWCSGMCATALAAWPTSVTA
jgi:hypothetical protein